MNTTIPTRPSLPSDRELNGSSNRRSVTQELGQSLFDNVLETEKRQSLSSEVAELGYGVQHAMVRTEPRADDLHSVTQELASERKETRSEGVKGPTDRKVDTNEGSVGTTELAEEPVEAQSARSAAAGSEGTEHEVSANAAGVEKGEAASAIELDLTEQEMQSDTSEFELDASQAEGVDASADPGGAPEGDMMSDEQSDGDAAEAELQESGELFEDVSMEAEIFGNESNGLGQAKSDAAAISSVDSNTSISDSSAGTTSLGRQAFARATSIQRAINAGGTAPAGVSTKLDMQDVVDQIDKARGSMTGSRARVVIGEGAERVAIMVSVKNGVVDIDLKASDSGVANALAEGSEELAKALGNHGLSLGDMGTGRETGEEAHKFQAEGSASGPVNEYEDTAEEGESSIRHGVRVVA